MYAFRTQQCSVRRSGRKRRLWPSRPWKPRHPGKGGDPRAALPPGSSPPATRSASPPTPAGRLPHTASYHPDVRQEPPPTYYLVWKHLPCACPRTLQPPCHHMLLAAVTHQENSGSICTLHQKLRAYQTPLLLTPGFNFEFSMCLNCSR